MGGRSRSRRSFGAPDAREALAALESCRRAMVAVCAKAPVGSQVYRAADAVLTAIDDMAGAITGDRERFWTPGHAAGEGPERP